MNFLPDGKRAHKYKRIGEQLVAQSKHLSIPSSITRRNGFVIKGSQQGSIEKTIVMSPMGAAVLCSTNDGMTVISADYWLGAFNPSRDVYIAENADGYFIKVTWGETELTNTQAIPDHSSSTYTLPPYAALSSTINEAIVIGTAVNLSNNNPYKCMYESNVSLFDGNGETVTRHSEVRDYSSVLFDGSIYGSNSPLFWQLPTMDMSRTVSHGTNIYRLSGGQPIAYMRTEQYSDGSFWYRQVTINQMYEGMPQHLLDEISPSSFMMTISHSCCSL